MQLPYSDQLNTASLARLFDNKSESYKLFWFKAILHEVGQDRREILFRDLIERMIVDAWYMVSEYRMNLGPSDTLEKTVLYISEQESFLPTEKETVLLHYLRNTEDNTLKGFMKTLSLNVPYRLQAPLMKSPATAVWRKPEAIVEYINRQPGMMYRIEGSGGLDSSVIIEDTWFLYLRSNLGILLGWSDYNLITYLQRRNPAVPGISNKIYPPQERKLTAVTNYWKYIIETEPVIDVYTGLQLTTKGLSIDHFIPWSYVASDGLWNLIPTVKSINSSKSNHLPDWDRYFDGLVNVEYNAYLCVSRDERAAQLFAKCAKENLNNEDIRFRLYRPDQSVQQFGSQLKEIILPVYDAARNMGFKNWVYE